MSFMNGQQIATHTVIKKYKETYEHSTLVNQYIDGEAGTYITLPNV
jgi:hypothetical protein